MDIDLILLHATTVGWLVVILGNVLRVRECAILEPLVWCGVAHLMFFSQPAQNIDGEVGLVHFLASISVLLGYGAYRLKVGRFNRPRLLKAAEDDSSGTAILYFLVACVAITLAEKTIAVLQGVSLVDAVLGMRLMTGQAKIAGEASLFFVLFSRTALVALVVGRVWILVRAGSLVAIAWWGLFASFLVTGFASGGRSAVVFPVFAVFIADVYVGRVLGCASGSRSAFVRKTTYMAIAVLVGCAMMYQSAFRAKEVSSFAEAWEGLRDQFSGSGVEETGFAGELRGGLNDTVAWVTDNYGQRVPFAYFYSPYAMAVNLFPRMYWPEKPSGWGRRVAWEILGQEPNSPGTSMAAGIGGEAYANGGYLGVIIYAFIFGLGFAVIKGAIWQPRSLVAAGFWLSTLLWMLGLWRGDWLSNINRMVYSLTTAWLLYRVCRWFSAFKRTSSWPGHFSGRSSVSPGDHSLQEHGVGGQ